jgi:serine/threonine-protein kinase
LSTDSSFTPPDGPPPALPASSRYRILAAIGSGGMATVFAGSLHGPNGFERRVAIKRAHSRLLAEPGTRQMLLQEARIASRMEHPHVVGVRDVEEIDGEILLVMDYVEGASLAALLAGGHLPLRVAGRILLDVAIGLTAVHDLAGGPESSPIVHRDVCPANILVGLDGSARLADFGIARATDWPHNTPAGTRRGKPAYMAPEYVLSGIATPKADVFALGIVAWETLTSERLFCSETALETMDRVLKRAIPAPSALASKVSPALDAAVLGALERDPWRRASAREFAVGLEVALRERDLVGTRREVELAVSQRCADAIRERRRRIREAAGVGSVSSWPAPPAGRDADVTRPILLRRRRRSRRAYAGAFGACVAIAIGFALCPAAEAPPTEASGSVTTTAAQVDATRGDAAPDRDALR